MWSSLPLHPTLASGLICSVEQFLTPKSRSPWIQWTHPFVRTPHTGWKPMPGTFLSGLYWEHSSAPSPSLLWSLLSVEAGLFSLRGLIPARVQVSRVEHTLGGQFALHISASPHPLGTFFSGPGPTQPPAAPLYHSNQTREETDVNAAFVSPWGVGERN